MVCAKLDDLVSSYLPENQIAYLNITRDKTIRRCYTFLPKDINVELQKCVLDNEHCSWGGEYYGSKQDPIHKNAHFIPTDWRYISQSCLEQKVRTFLSKDVENICALATFDDKLSTEEYSNNKIYKKIEQLLCFNLYGLQNSWIFDWCDYFDMFGFLSKAPTNLFTHDGEDNSIITHTLDDIIISSSMHIFLGIHEGESICILDLD